MYKLAHINPPARRSVAASVVATPPERIEAPAPPSPFLNLEFTAPAIRGERPALHAPAAE